MLNESAEATSLYCRAAEEAEETELLIPTYMSERVNNASCMMVMVSKQYFCAPFPR